MTASALDRPARPIDVQETALSVAGMDCASCVAHVEKAARGVPGVEAAQVNLARGRAVVRFDAAKTSTDHIAAAITDAGYVSVPEAAEDPARAEEARLARQDRKSTRLNSSHANISYAVFCLKK